MAHMTPAEFKTKWAKFSGKESAAYAEHFNDLCRVLGVPTPIEADPTGNDTFCFQKHVAKDGELFDFNAADDAAPAKHARGFADVWKRDCFGWEYKGPGEDLEKAYMQLLRYRESLLNPPLLIVCDFARFIVRTNFNGAVQETHSFTNAEIDTPDAIRVLRAALTKPEDLRPRETTAEVTEKLAQQIAALALSLQKREAVELANAKTRRQHSVAQKQNLRIARFLNRLVFCFFAEDTDLLPRGIFADVCKAGANDPQHFAESLEDLFRCMAKGGRFGTQKIRHFNGHLFEESTVFELTPEEIAALATAAAANWQNIQPSIMGTLFQRALDESQRAALGAQYTGETDIRHLLEPVLMAPLRREWTALKVSLLASLTRGKGTPEERTRIENFLKKLRSIIVLDPACGSGNFLYVALQLLLALEKEVITAAAALGWTLSPQVNVQQLRAIELNAYAFELAQVSVQIGFLQWRRDNGFDNDRSPVLQNLDGFENKDALLNETFRKKPKNLKAAQAEEHGREEELFKVYTERAWPACNVMVGNPPFLGGKMLRRELGDAYVDALFENFGGRVRPEADLCCYWFEKARQQIEEGHCQRVGLLATQGIRGGANRDVLKRIKGTGGIFFAESDRDWILAGANVHVSMIGFDNGAETLRTLDGKAVAEIHANLAASAADITTAHRLARNLDIAFMGDTKGGAFDIAEERALEMLREPNPHGRPNSDVLLPWVNGLDVMRRPRRMFIIDFGLARTEEDCAKYDTPFAHVRERVRPERLGNKRALYARYWWRHVEPRPGMLAALAPLPRFLTSAAVTKHRLFAWLESPTLPDHQVFAFALDDDFSLGVLHSQIHEAWARAQGTQVRERESGFRYTPTSCFETFPLPDPSAEQRAAIADAAKELNALRESWLNPPEWTAPRTLTFPGAIDGPWRRFVRDANAHGIGTVHYPLTEPRDAECAVKLAKRTLTNLYNERPAWLANAHAKLDAAVAAAYGFPADAPDDEILSRLLALNLERAAAEKAAVLSTPAKKRTAREKRGDEML
ncbi:MAG: class I SAM-dependent DNA methyltransferase [Chthoniobacterales bacterium]|nr:class I SAM-dependent DNA methyltransferase [Chthoniobacterales bacterium]